MRWAHFDCGEDLRILDSQRFQLKIQLPICGLADRQGSVTMTFVQRLFVNQFKKKPLDCGGAFRFNHSIGLHGS